MRVLDIFSGVGGFSLGLQRANFTPVMFCEIDELCRSELAKQWPGIPIHGDIRTLTVPAGFADVICGGFPCQDISTARSAKATGLMGARSGLWFEMLRLVRECRPSWVLVENVTRLRTLGADRVLSDLEEAGYTARALVVGAAHAGAPHPRSRVWIIANADSIKLREHPRGSGRQSRAEALQPSHDDADADRDNEPSLPVDAEVAGGESLYESAFPVWERRAGSIQSHALADGVPADLAGATAALGNAVIPQLVESIGRAIMAASHERGE